MNENEEPRVGVFVCHCGVNISGVVNVQEVVEYASKLPKVAYAEGNLYTCSSEGLSKIKEAIAKFHLNKVVVASCTPRTHETLFRGACEEAGLNKYLFHMANIREHCSWVHPTDPKKATEKAKEIVRMAVAKVVLLEPQTEPEIDVLPSALVIGGGVAGIAAALSLANQGFTAHVIEKENEIGGKLKELYKLYPNNSYARNILEEFTQAARSNPNIEVHTSSTVKQVEGFIGNFKVKIDHEGKEEPLDIGTIIVATGADVLRPDGLYHYGESKNVLTQLEFEQLMKDGKLGRPRNVVMIQCVGAREEKEGGRNYCSRICCAVAVKNALQIKETSPETEVYVLYRDMQTYGKNFEEQYRQAREGSVQFIRYDKENPPEVFRGSDGKLTVKVRDIMLNAPLELDADLIILSTPLVQGKETKELSKILKVPLGSDGFFFEAHVKLRPVDFATEGIFVCGTAHSPKTIAESIVQAYATASRAGIPMAVGRVRTEAITASVEEGLCTGCGTCIRMCPYGAIQKDERGIARVNDVLCKGCGVCSASCPEKAIKMKHFSDAQVLAEATASLGGP
jgi:heterodisulfide reductase subunit A